MNQSELKAWLLVFLISVIQISIMIYVVYDIRQIDKVIRKQLRYKNEKP